MPGGSAASLRLPQGPLFPSSFARRPRLTLLPHEPGPLPLSAMRPLQTGADDPPRGRVLIVWDDAAAALELQRRLRELDYAVVGPAGCRDDVERLTARPAGLRRPIDCALVSVGMPEAERIADRLAEESVPLVWLASDGEAVLPVAHAHAPVLDRPGDRAALAAAIAEAERQRAGRRWYPTSPPQAWPRLFPQL